MRVKEKLQELGGKQEVGEKQVTSTDINLTPFDSCIFVSAEVDESQLLLSN